ncbi:unnamed protein product [Polarella glacialis]|uniref:Uncharacterized protein n=1 Tax=Polarella glacialis TaxID=89957 RepID=A0A813KR16_POLGL|nr:unnamed protein product [Polarella glacialis]
MFPTSRAFHSGQLDQGRAPMNFFRNSPTVAPTNDLQADESEEDAGLLWSSPEEGGSDGSEGSSNNLELPPSSLGGSIYTLVIISLVLGAHALASKSKSHSVAWMRLASFVVLDFALFSLKLFLLLSIHRLVEAQSVSAIKELYQTFETTMYGNWTELSPYNLTLGIPGHLRQAAFTELPEIKQKAICQIPLAHFRYSFVILAIWSLTTVQYGSKQINQVHRLVWSTPNISSMSKAVAKRAGAVKEVVGLTTPCKVLIITCVMVPRLMANVFLLGLGCRWLLATADLQELLLNALALEFILLLDVLLYEVLVAEQSKHVVRNTLVQEHDELVNPTWCSTLKGTGVTLLNLGCVYFYMAYFQTVLPGFNWDLRESCSQHDPWALW